MTRFSSARFLTSAHTLRQFPSDDGAEVAFAGRSNSGKSSAINAIVERRGLARTSATPGRTQLVNFFELGPACRLVDLPGYGYANAPPAARDHWLRLLDDYFAGRRSLRALVLLRDVRREFNKADRKLIGWAGECDCPLLVLLTKADKLGRAQARKALQAAAASLGEAAEVLLFSVRDGSGVAEARERLAGWLDTARVEG